MINFKTIYFLDCIKRFLNFFTRKKDTTNTPIGASTLVIGIGGGGQNIVNYIKENNNLCNLRLLAVNSDEQVLKSAKVETLLFKNIPKNYTNSLGCGGDVNLAQKLAKTNVKRLAGKLKNISSVILIATLGGGFGTGALPVIANFLNSRNLQIFVIATLPFCFEGQSKRSLALKGLEALRKETTNFLLIENQIILTQNSKHQTFKEAFDLINRRISEYIVQNRIMDKSGENDRFRYCRQF